MASEYLKWKYRDVKPDEPPPPLTGWPKVKNWIYYNWRWVLAIAVVVAIVVSLVWSALGIGKTKPDYTVAYVGTKELSDEAEEAVLAALRALGEDVNGDGEVNIQLRTYVKLDSEVVEDSIEYNTAVSVRLAADMTSGESVFFLTDDPQALQTAYQILATPDGSAPAEDDFGWEGKALALGDLPALKLGDDTGLYIGRRFFEEDDKRQKNKEADDALWAAITEGAAP